MSSLSMLNASTAAAAAYVQSMTGSSGTQTTTTVGLGLGISSQFSAAGLKADGSSNSANSMLLNDGPPTPTQEMDMVGGDHRKCEYATQWKYGMNSFKKLLTILHSCRWYIGVFK